MRAEIYEDFVHIELMIVSYNQVFCETVFYILAGDVKKY